MKHINKRIFNKIGKNLTIITRHREHTFWILTLLHYNISLIAFLYIYLFPVNHFCFKIGVARLKFSSDPPTIIVSDAALAPTSPPDTGASR